MKCLCVTDCYHRGRRYYRGEVYTFGAVQDMPSDKKGNVRHFQVLQAPAVVKNDPAPKKEPVQKKEDSGK